MLKIEDENHCAYFIDPHTICLERTIDVPVKKIWSALTKPKELEKWFMETKLELKVGGQYTITDAWEGWIKELKTNKFIQFNSEAPKDDEAYHRFELEKVDAGILIRLTNKLPKDYVISADKKALPEWASEDMKKINKLEFYQPGGVGTLWVGLVAGWHCFLDALEEHLTGEPIGLGHTFQCLMYYPLFEDYFTQEETA